MHLEYKELLLITTLLVLTPGPKIVFCINTLLDNGPKPAQIFFVGTFFGNGLLSLVTACVLTGIGSADSLLLFAMKWLGVGIILILGCKQFVSLRSRVKKAEKIAGKWIVFGQGVTLALLNPKSVVLFASILPQYMDFSGAIFQQVAVFGAIFAFFDALALGLFSALAHPIQKLISTEMRKLIAGSLYMVAGMVLAGRMI